MSDTFKRIFETKNKMKDLNKLYSIKVKKYNDSFVFNQYVILRKNLINILQSI
jgi:hypothetical protein